MTTFPVVTILGHPRIGRNRELKKVLEVHWVGRANAGKLFKTEAGLRQANLVCLIELGLRTQDASLPENSSLYDQVFDVTSLFGAISTRFEGRRGLEFHFTPAHGDQGSAPEEMTKWPDTNYHYLIPKTGPNTPISYTDNHCIERFLEAKNWGYLTRPATVNPVIYLVLVEVDEQASEDYDPLERLPEVQAVYATLLSRLEEMGATRVQSDESVLVSGNLSHMRSELAGLAKPVYTESAGASNCPRILVTMPYGNESSVLPVFASCGVEVIRLVLGLGTLLEPGALDLDGVDFAVGAIDARSIWRADLVQTAALLKKAKLLGTRSLCVATTNPPQHVLYDTALETQDDPELDANLCTWLAFVDQKVGEVVTLAKGTDEGFDAIVPQTEEPTRILREWITASRTVRPGIRERVGAPDKLERARTPYGERVAAQDARLALPVLLMIAIGSFPQVASIRKARTVHTKGTPSDTDYRVHIKREIAEVVTLQEKLGLDVLVRGKAECSDMVQCFAELLDGFAATRSGWVQSYDSRCTRPSIPWGDVACPRTMTVGRAAFTQSLTDKPVKRVLTGPVTIIAWSFPRNDLGLAEIADQIGPALRDEVEDPEATGTAIIRVNESALRELLPLGAEDHADYLRWSADSSRVATVGARLGTRVRAHLCHSEFGRIIDATTALDADVISTETVRSRMEVLPELAEIGFDYGIDPDAWDIHSPRIPSIEEACSLIDAALSAIPVERLQVNPDCGLKTRGYEKALTSLSYPIRATKEVREAF